MGLGSMEPKPGTGISIYAELYGGIHEYHYIRRTGFVPPCAFVGYHHGRTLGVRPGVLIPILRGGVIAKWHEACTIQLSVVLMPAEAWF